MDETTRQLSIVIESVSKALSEWTVTRHGELDPTLPERFGDGWRATWVADVQHRVRQLAQAVAVRSPGLFAEVISWARVAYVARSMTDDDLRTSLECMRGVLNDELPETAAATANSCITAAIEMLGQPVPPTETALVNGSPHRRLILEYVEALLEGRRRAAEGIILRAADEGMSVRELYRDVLQPSQIEIGQLWHRNDITVADEHFATATTEAVLANLRLRAVPAAPNGRTVVATAVGGELHAVGIRMVADFFEFDGWNTLYLGANTPNGDLVELLRTYRVHLLAASITHMLQLRTLGELIEIVRADEALADLRIIVGGWPFRVVPDLWRELDADGSAASADEAVALGNALVGS